MNRSFYTGILVIISFVVSGYFLSSCSKGSDPAPTTTTNDKITYQKDIKILISIRCTPCHLPPDGFETIFSTYDAAKGKIDEMIRRLQLPRSDEQSMPYKFPMLSNTEIQKFIKWKDDGLLEK